MKKLWNKLHCEAPALVPSLEAVLSDVSVQLKCADENLQTLNHHLHKYVRMCGSSVTYTYTCNVWQAGD